jgi:hypothetical protein
MKLLSTEPLTLQLDSQVEVDHLWSAVRYDDVTDPNSGACEDPALVDLLERAENMLSEGKPVSVKAPEVELVVAGFGRLLEPRRFDLLSNTAQRSLESARHICAQVARL